MEKVVEIETSGGLKKKPKFSVQSIWTCILFPVSSTIRVNLCARGTVNSNHHLFQFFVFDGKAHSTPLFWPRLYLVDALPYLLKHTGHDNKGNDHQTWDALMFVQILSTGTIRNVWRTLRGICILILGVKGLSITVTYFFVVFSCQDLQWVIWIWRKRTILV